MKQQSLLDDDDLTRCAWCGWEGIDDHWEVCGACPDCLICPDCSKQTNDGKRHKCDAECEAREAFQSLPLALRPPGLVVMADGSVAKWDEKIKWWRRVKLT